ASVAAAAAVATLAEVRIKDRRSTIFSHGFFLAHPSRGIWTPMHAQFPQAGNRCSGTLLPQGARGAIVISPMCMPLSAQGFFAVCVRDRVHPRFGSLDALSHDAAGR